VAQDVDGLTHNEESYPNAVASCGIETSEGLENPRHLVSADADSGVIYVDAHVIADVTAPEENAASGLSVFDGVAYQVAQDGTEKQGIALNRGVGRDHAKPNSLPQGGKLVLTASLLEQGTDSHWCQLHPVGFTEPKGGK
jgi:hypothetical protein